MSVPESDPIIASPFHRGLDSRRHGRHGQVTKGERQRVGRIRRLWRLSQAKERRNHSLHLLLGRRAVPGDRLLYRVRGVLDDFAPGARRRGQRQTACLPHRHSGAHIHLKEEPLDRHHVGLDIGNERGQVRLKGSKALGQWI
jgi:hypothetical protein